MSVSHINTSVSKAVSYAISHGYQIAPDALRLLQQLEKSQDEKNKRESVLLDSILQLAIEEKVRATIGQSSNESTNTIAVRDLIAIEPDLFEGLQAESKVS
ncbi:MAG: hypothetical protein PXY39_04420, partial [archaeon]|nr:hypothetical protein [archaeon]